MKQINMSINFNNMKQKDLIDNADKDQSTLLNDFIDFKKGSKPKDIE